MKTITVDEFRQLSKPGPRKGEPRAGWEAEFADYLQQQKMAKEIIWWAYEPIAIILAHGRQGVRGLRYEPDFVVVNKWMQTIVYEVKRPKGKGRQLGVNKLKVAAEKFPGWFFYLVSKVSGEWRFRDFSLFPDRQEKY